MKVEVKTEHGWVARQPKDGEIYREVYPTGHTLISTYLSNSAIEQLELIPVVFTGVTGATTVSGDFAKITAKDGVTIAISGTLAIPDRAFITPIQKENISTGEISTLYVETQVVGGEFSVELALPVGKYRITQELMNAELPQPVFSLTPIEIYITI
ncbi:hypothetical protein [Vibrio vulnificus]|uniref:hypothetical protein n=1 Tax=Vibrio vulnificus TaxID=672 RepID=UPI001F03311D|nr:hypothetical protein [Vibrio vulnificus]MCG9651485.1 hypothetical protein [Vibrio vulnificus]